MTFRRFVASCIPPVIKNCVRPGEGSRWVGFYPTWSAASHRADGYDQEAILSRIELAVRQVLGGNGNYERDGIIFSDNAVRWPVVASILLAQANCPDLKILDFGGSLGSLWLQHRGVLAGIKLDWRIIEQPAFVTRGRSLFPTGQPSFHGSPAEAFHLEAPSLAIFSAVLPYLQDPVAVITQVKSMSPEYILIDRTSVHTASTDRLSIQHVPATIYRASYPCWIFAKRHIPQLLESDYELVSEYPCEDRANDPTIAFVGWLFKRRSRQT